MAGVGQLALARVDDLDGETVWRARASRAARVAQSGVAEVGDDDDQAGRAREAPDPRASASRQPRRLGCAPSGATPAREHAPQRRQRARGRRAAAAAGTRRAAASRPTRPPRRTASRDDDLATPSATSHLSRSAVPNAIEAETSSTSQVVSVRSGTCSADVRHAGAGARGGVEPAHVVAGLVRAQLRELGAGAERRRARCSPGSTPAARRASARSSALDQRAGHRRPGPGGPGGDDELRARSRGLGERRLAGRRPTTVEDAVEQRRRASRRRRARRR